MNLLEAIKAVSTADQRLPDEALRWMLDNWDAARPALTLVLARCARDPEGASDDDFVTGYFGLHLLAAKRETRAFPLFCALAKMELGLPEMLGDALMLTTSRIIISLFDGNVAALHDLTQTGADMAIRVAAFDAIAWATAHGVIGRDDTHAFLNVFAERGAKLPPEDVCWDGWAVCAAILGFEDLRPQIEAACADARIDPAMLEFDDVKPLFELAREDPSGKAALEREGMAPIDDAIVALHDIEKMLDYAAEHRGDEEQAPRDDDALAPIVNPNRDVGRNDPCPCGSGKKYKKCCLAA